MRLSRDEFGQFVRLGKLSPSRIFTPLYRVSRQALTGFDNQSQKKLIDHYRALEQRMTVSSFRELRMAVGLAWRSASGYFPAYRYHIGEFLNDEWLSCVDWHKTFHRDHVSHQVMCYWVARELVDANDEGLSFGKKTLRELCVKQAMEAPECRYLQKYAEEMGVFEGIKSAAEKKFVWECLFDESLFLAAMFHDIGYPWQFVQGIASQFEDHSPLVMPAYSDCSKLYDDYGHRLVCYPLHGYQVPSSIQPVAWRKHAEMLLKLGQTKTHGLPGALAFLFLNDIVRDYPAPQVSHAKGLFCIEWAAMAIMMHDMQKIYVGEKGKPKPEHPCLRVSFDRDPLSFVMTLVDQIQDFCRPNARFAPCGCVKSGDEAIDLTYGACCNEGGVTSCL